MADVEQEAREALDELDLNWEYDETAIPKVAAALRKAEARVWREAAAVARDCAGDVRTKANVYAELIERAEKLEKGE